MTDKLARIMPWTPEQYHSDPCSIPSLSSSIAHTLISASPLHAFTEHPKLGGKYEPEDPGTKAKHAGGVIHEMLLKKGKGFVVVNADAWRTDAAKAQRDQAVAAGKVPLLSHQYDAYNAAAERIRERCKSMGITFDGDTEVAVEWYEELDDGTRVLCRSMFDLWKAPSGLLIDVKTCRSANPRDLSRHFCEYGYDIQGAAYPRALVGLEPELQGRVDMLFLFCEIEPPYTVLPARADGALREIGLQRWLRAARAWHNCLTSGHWPDYADNGPVLLEAPAWEIARELGNYEGAST